MMVTARLMGSVVIARKSSAQNLIRPGRQFLGNEGAGLPECGACFRQDGSKYLPAVRNIPPDLERGLDACATRIGEDASRIVEQYLTTADLEEQRRQACKIGIKPIAALATAWQTIIYQESCGIFVATS